MNKILPNLVFFLYAHAAFAADTATLSVSDKGLGGITRATRFHQTELQKALRGYHIKPEKRSTEGEPYPVFLVMDQKALLATINPTEDHKKIFSIRITSNKISNTHGPAIGTKYSAIYGGNVSKECAGGAEEMSGAVICPAPKSRNVGYVFRGKSNGPDGVVPRIAVLKDFAVSEIVWRP